MPNIDETPPLNAEGFLKAFIQSYNEKFNENQKIWENIWTNTYSWSTFMIKHVIGNMEDRIGLRCHNGEPLRLDAVFTTSDKWDWFPISIALEHENNPAGVHGEINKLISIDCQLKVMITYSIIGEKKIEWVKRKIIESFFEALHRADHLCSRNREYLFIIGDENGHPRELSWEYAIFRHNCQEETLHWKNSRDLERLITKK